MTSEQSGELERAPSERSEALPVGTMLLRDQFTITGRISNGGFGITYLAKDNYLDRDVVIKECFPEVFCHREGNSVLVRSRTNMEKYRSIVDMFMREARSIAKLRHPNIVGVHRVFEDNDTAYMTLDLIEGHDMRRIITKHQDTLSPDQVRKILIKLLDAIDMVHQQDLLHRDISPDNILLDKWGNPVLIDFGAAREEASRETRAMSALLVVKDGYSPQEFYFAGGKQTPCSDLYALAASFYHLITGEAPPNSQTRMAEVASENPDPCRPLAGRFNEYEPAFLSAIDRAMSVLPKDRIQSAKEWTDIITRNSKAASPLLLVHSTPSESKPNLGRKLSRLISETNEYVLQSQPIEPETRKIAPPSTPKVSQTPDWIREFNEETSELKTRKPARPKAKERAEPKAEPVVVERTIVETPIEFEEDFKERPGLAKRMASSVGLSVDPVRLTWMGAVFCFSVVQTDNLIKFAESLLN